MGYFIFAFYVLLFCFLIARVKFFRNSGLGQRTLIVLFLIKMLAGLVNCYINVFHYPVSDALVFHEQGLVEYHLLFTDTREYLTNIFKTNYANYSGFLEASNSFWNDLRTNIIAKMLSIFDVFSFQNFYINNLFFDFLVFFGGVYLYKVFVMAFQANKELIIICVFLLPSVLYFTSGIHRDGLIFLALSISVYHLYYILEEKSFSWKRALSTLFFLCFILLLRNFVFITLLPPLIAWIMSSQFSPRYPLVNFLGIYIICAVIFFSSSLLGPEFNLPSHVSEKQAQFIEIAKGGASGIGINPLYPNLKSFLSNAPQAINHSLMRPYLSEHPELLYIPLALEIFIYEVLFLLFIFFRRPGRFPPFSFFCLFFSLSMFLIIGYTIPILGALVRYRSIYFPFLLIPIMSHIDGRKIKILITYSKK